MKIEDLLKLEESKTLEFKESTLPKDKLLASVIAFANTSGGKVIIGVKDKNKQVIGIKDPYLEEERLATLISDSTSPRLLPTIEIFPWRDTHLIIIDVPLSSTRPHYIASKGPLHSTFVRVGSTNRLADAPMLESLKRSIQARTYDEEPLSFLSLEDFNEEEAHKAFRDLKEVTLKDLASLGLLAKNGESFIPTVGGILLFGKDKQTLFPDAWIQAGCFAGVNKVNIIDSLSIMDSFLLAPQITLNFIRRHIQVGLSIKGLTHEEKWHIPQVALREAIMNAILHADYELRGSPIRVAIFDDRLEIENPGLIPYGLTIEDITSGLSKVRNRVLARVFRELRLIEQWGSGITRMFQSCREAGLPAPKFEEVSGRFRVTFYRDKITLALLDETDEKILCLLASKGPLQTKDIAAYLELTRRSTRPRLLRLVEKGKIVEVARSHKDPNKKYILT